jgi:K+-sensing histidine kinase KdpD
MNERTDRLFFTAGGPVAAIFLGVALVPFREWTTASNFSFLFLALIIAVAEFGGRAAALTTGVASTLCLDFFLTRPYLSLSVSEKGDIIACLGLAGCGLLAATLSDRRPGNEAQREVKVLHAVLDALGEKTPLEERLAGAIRRCRDLLSLAAVVIRDDRGHVVASSAPMEGMRPVPTIILSDSGRLRESKAGEALLPRAGARVPLQNGGREVGWLDFWGEDLPAEPGQWQAIGDVAAAVGLSMASSGADR